MAVVNAFDAMTSQRPYNQPISFGAAAAWPRAGAISAWDPAIVAIFVEWLQATDWSIL